MVLDIVDENDNQVKGKDKSVATLTVQLGVAEEVLIRASLHTLLFGAGICLLACFLLLICLFGCLFVVYFHLLFRLFLCLVVCSLLFTFIVLGL
jgi:hypothetical protein